MIFEKSWVIEFGDQYRMRVEGQMQYKIIMNGQIMKKVN